HQRAATAARPHHPYHRIGQTRTGQTPQRAHRRSGEGSMAGSRKAYERLGAKVLTLPDVVAQSVGFMGPVFSSAFVIPLVIGVASPSGRGGGIATPLSVLIAAVGVFALGWIVSRYAKEIHSAGSLYDYVSRGLGERIGTAAGWLYYAGITVLLAGLLLLIGGYVPGTLPSGVKIKPPPSWGRALILIAPVGRGRSFSRTTCPPPPACLSP